MPMPGRLYRTLVRVPLAYVAAVRQRFGADGQKALLRDIRARLRAMGFAETLLAMQDPTNNERVNVLARPGAFLRPDPVVRVISMEHVEEPPAPSPLGLAAAFDPGMTDDEAMAVIKALVHDRNARHLAGLASTLEPTFPGAASMLRAKAELIERRAWMNEETSQRLLARATKPVLPEQAQRIVAARAAFEASPEAQKGPQAIARDGVRHAVIGLLEQSKSLASFPTATRQLAESLVSNVEFSPDGRITHHLPLVHPSAMALALPPEPNDTFVSPSALQLVLALQKPAWSKVTNTDGITQAIERIEAKARVQNQRGAQIGLAHDPVEQITRARHQIDRAQKAIDRRRWIEWYRTQPGHVATL